MPENQMSRKEAELLNYLREHPIIAASDLLVLNGKPLMLAPHQRVILKSLWEDRPFNLLILSRGMGKTLLLAVYLVLRAMLYPREKCGIVSATYRQAQFVFDEIVRFYQESDFLKAATEKEPSKTPTQCHMRLTNGSDITALPLGDGTKIRGARFYRLCVDETAQVDPEIIDLVLMPFLNVNRDPMNPDSAKRNNQLIMASSAYYQFNHLYEKYLTYRNLVGEGHPDYTLHMFNYHDAPEGFINLKNIEHQKRTMPRVQFLMENENIFPADSEGFLPASLIHSASRKWCRLESEGSPRAEYVLGIDPARRSDNCAFVVIKIGGADSANRIVGVETLNRRSFPEMVEHTRRLLARYNIVRIAIDQGGGGTTIADLLGEETDRYNPKSRKEEAAEPLLVIGDRSTQGRSGRRIIDLVYFSSKVVNDMNHDLKADLENGRLVFPSPPQGGDVREDEAYQEMRFLEDELSSIVATPLKNGFLNFDTPSDKMRKDRYSALLLAAKAARDYLQTEPEEKPRLVTGFWLERL